MHTVLCTIPAAARSPLHSAAGHSGPPLLQVPKYYTRDKAQGCHRGGCATIASVEAPIYEPHVSFVTAFRRQKGTRVGCVVVMTSGCKLASRPPPRHPLAA